MEEANAERKSNARYPILFLFSSFSYIYRSKPKRWREQEAKQLCDLVYRYEHLGKRKWRKIAEEIPGKNAAQVRDILSFSLIQDFSVPNVGREFRIPI